MLPEGLSGFVKSNEGFRAVAYKDVAGVWTVGYGFTGTLSDGREVKPGVTMTAEAADRELESRLETLCAKIRKAYGGKITDGQLMSLADFAYNLGFSRLLTSTLFRKFRSGDVLGAAMEFQAWSLAGNRRSRGLLVRRLRDALILVASGA